MSEYCRRAKPRPKRLEASVSSTVSRVGSKYCSMVGDASSFFILSKAICWSSVHLNCTFLRSRPLSGSESPARLSTKVPSWLARPRNECRLVREVGVEKSVSAENTT